MHLLYTHKNLQARLINRLINNENNDQTMMKTKTNYLDAVKHT